MERPMKSLLCTPAILLGVALLIAAPLACAQNDGVSLGDAARAQKAKRGNPSPNAKVYDNDNLPKGGAISTTTGDYGGIAAAPASKSSSTAATTASTSTAASTAKGKDSKEQTPDEATKAQTDEFAQKVADAKKNITQLEREVDVMQRENRLKAAAFYGDAGTKLRDGARYQADDQKQQETLKAKQDELAAAKAALDQIRDDIRKAGLPSSIGE